ncbi:hypothetical protein ACG1BZ_14745 [Microbulbifer sp. CNSA002]|uniref:hypothetical protein n=1 Tax=unclassified Microbulbifer TaxID=2619833 RepID=UPI0039B508F7
MLNKFLSGVTLGAGFSISALCVYTIWMFYVFPLLIDQSFTSKLEETENLSQLQHYENTPNFHNLPVDDQIELATAIIIVKFEEGDNGSYRSVVEEILKKEDGIELYYNVGEVYEEAPTYNRSKNFMQERAIVFM